MTAQIKGRVTLDGEHLDWRRSPGLPESHPRIKELDWNEFEHYSTNNWAGYCSYWEIRDKKLYLTGLSGRKYELIAGEPLFAEWYSGPAIVGYGADCDGDWDFMRLLHIEFERGVVIGQREELCKNTPLCIEDVEALLAGGADINTWFDKWNSTMLHSAIEASRHDVLKFLLSKGARVTQDMLSLAVKTGNRATVKIFLAAAANTKAAATHLLHHAAHFGNINFVRLLLVNGADVNSRLKALSDGQPPLFRAAARGHTDVVALLIADGADVNVTDNAGLSPLHAAVSGGHKGAAELLIEKRADIHVRDQHGASLLQIALSGGDMETAALLIEKGADIADVADINARDGRGRTPVHAAAASGASAVAQVLIAHGADVNARDGDGHTPLHAAASSGADTIAQLLIAHGADINAKDGHGRTPLHDAAWKATSIVQLLIAHGADVNARATIGESPIYVAARSGSLETVELLIAHGADINAQDERDNTPLHAAAGEAKSIVQLLISHGADVNARNKDGESPIFRSAWGGYKEIAELLIAHGADIHAKANNGTTPLDGAVFFRKTEVAELLRQLGGQAQGS